MNPDLGAAAECRGTHSAQLLWRAAATTGTDRERLLEQVIRLNIPVARSVARRYAHRGEPAEDLVQVACVGLVKAVRAFDPHRGTDLLSFAVPTMTGEIKRHFRDHAWTIRPPRRIQDLQADILAAAADLAQQFGRPAHWREVAELLGVDHGVVEQAAAAGGCYSPRSLHDDRLAAGGATVVDPIADVEKGYDRVEATQVLASVCPRLKPRDRQILYLRFYRCLTQQEIADELGVTQMQVSRLLARILATLRAWLNPPAPQSRPTRPVTGAAVSRAHARQPVRARAL